MSGVETLEHRLEVWSHVSSELSHYLAWKEWQDWIHTLETWIHTLETCLWLNIIEEVCSDGPYVHSLGGSKEGKYFFCTTSLFA